MKFDAVVVGGGHNGLVAASYLAMEGMSVALLERRELVGGACVSEELWPGVRVSTGAYVLSLLRPKVIRDLRLYENGLKVYMKDPGLFLPLGNAKSLSIWSDTEKTSKEISKFSKKDALEYPRWVKFWDQLYDLFDLLMLSPPVDVKSLLPSLSGLLSENLEEFAQVFLKDAESMLRERFESEELISALIEDSVVGTFLPPSAPGTAYVLAHHVLGEVNGVKGAWGYVEGGMGGVTRAMERAARSMGVKIFTNAEVDEILVKGNSVTGVKLRDGRIIESKVVLSNADPKTTFLKMLRNAEIDPSLLRRISSIKSRGTSFKLVGYLEELPDFGKGKHLSPEHSSSILIMPEVKYVERAYSDAVSLGKSREPWLSINIQSALDPTVAPSGKFSFSIFGQYLPYAKDLDDIKDEYGELVLDKVREYAPNFKPARYEVLTPLDLERRFGLWEGHIFHGEMTPDQLYLFRPIPRMSRYSTLINGLYLCGAGTHPGGGVTGAPGYNAAQQVIHDLKRQPL